MEKFIIHCRQSYTDEVYKHLTTNFPDHTFEIVNRGEIYVESELRFRVVGCLCLSGYHESRFNKDFDGMVALCKKFQHSKIESVECISHNKEKLVQLGKVEGEPNLFVFDTNNIGLKVNGEYNSPTWGKVKIVSINFRSANICDCWYIVWVKTDEGEKSLTFDAVNKTGGIFDWLAHTNLIPIS